MSMYHCHNCDAWVDDDYHPMENHPWAHRSKKYQYDVVCPECAVEIEEEARECAEEDYYDN